MIPSPPTAGSSGGRLRDRAVALLYTGCLFVGLPLTVWRLRDPAPQPSSREALPLVWFEAVDLETPVPPDAVEPQPTSRAVSPPAASPAPPAAVDATSLPTDARGVDLGTVPLGEHTGLAIALPELTGRTASGRDVGPVEPPRPLVQAEPVYPPAARLRGIGGTVVVEFTVAEDGRTRDATVTEAEPAGVFDAAVLRAVADWRFAPATRDGRAIRARLLQTVRFRPDAP